MVNSRRSEEYRNDEDADPHNDGSDNPPYDKTYHHLDVGKGGDQYLLDVSYETLEVE